MSPYSSDYITPDFYKSSPTASTHLSVLPFGIVVEPSSKEAWLLVVSYIRVRCSSNSMGLLTTMLVNRHVAFFYLDQNSPTE
jgi:hypothetical protein